MPKADARQLHGVLVLNKPSGPTSNRCLMAIKHLGQKKIGHVDIDAGQGMRHFLAQVLGQIGLGLEVDHHA